ncbi:acyl-CoA-binding protein [Gammaproteobacteria bacterium 45_16_T64]|nr:acyl-CoA-binding protein [Gammaproteobacteria bacterium 45_16_T64]
MSDVKSQFEAAVNYVKTVEGDSFKPSNDLKLEMYGLFKQGSSGDVQGKRPGMTNFIARAKYDAWAKLKGTSGEQAMQSYIDKIEGLKGKHS